MAFAAAGGCLIIRNLRVALRAGDPVVAGQHHPSVIMGVIIPVFQVVTRPAVTISAVTLVVGGCDGMTTRTIPDIRHFIGSEIFMAFTAIERPVCSGHGHDLGIVLESGGSPPFFRVTPFAIESKL